MKNYIIILFLFLSFQGFSQTDSKNKLSQAEIKSFIILETRQGGKLDFFTEIKGKEYDASQVKPGLFMTNLEMALYKWGLANFQIGVENENTALKIFEEFKGRELNIREKDLIPMGYRNDLIR